MPTKQNTSRIQHLLMWRSVTACLLTIAGLTALTVYMGAHWAQRQLLTTDNWVSVVSPLPKDDTVANALSTYSVNQLFTTADLQYRIQQALPDRAAFLAPPLTEQLQSRLIKRTQQVVQSNQFQSAWEAANRTAIDRLLDSTRNPSESQRSQTARFSLNLSSLKETVISLLDERTGVEISTGQFQTDRTVSIGVRLKTSLETVRTYIRTVDFVNATFWLLAAVCLLGALLFSRSRRKLLLIMSGSVLFISLLQIIGVKAVRPYILNQVQDIAYRPAASVIYDTLVASFRSSAIVVLVVSVLVIALLLMLRWPLLTKNKFIADWRKAVKQSTIWKRGATIRQHLYQYRYQATGLIAAAGLAIVAFTVTLTLHNGVRSLLFIVLAIELVYLIALPATKARKQ